MMIKYIYTFFIGVLLATFIGVGIAAFYEAPKRPEVSINETVPIKEASDSAFTREYQIKQEKAYREYQKLEQDYSRNVSIITTIFSVIIVIISLTFLKKLAMISDGLLLGGLFTQLYSIVRGFASQDNKFRFIVVTIGLAAVLTVGYLKFIDKKESSSPQTVDKLV